MAPKHYWSPLQTEKAELEEETKWGGLGELVRQVRTEPWKIESWTQPTGKDGREAPGTLPGELPPVFPDL